MTRLVTFLSLASHRVTLTHHPSAPAASSITSLHPSALLVLAILVFVTCITLVARLVRLVAVNLVAQFVQVAAEVFGRMLLVVMVVGVLVTLILMRI
jgi:hypothetical protein